MHPYSIMYQNIMRKGLILFNKCANYFSFVKQYIYHTYENIKQSLCNYDHSLWVFLPGHSLPLPLSVISNPSDYWKYDTHANQLIHYSTMPLTKYILSLLSAKLLITESVDGKIKEYDMDPFLETFSVHTVPESPPSMNMIFMAWCAHHKLWFPADCPIYMEYIDHLGNFIKVNLADNPIIHIQQHKLYISNKI
jgi:hypothetical protein